MSALEALKARRQAAQAAQLTADGTAALQEGAAAASGTQAAGSATTSTSSSTADGERVMHVHPLLCPCMDMWHLAPAVSHVHAWRSDGT